MSNQNPISLRDVPCSSNSRLHFSWGVGSEIFCCDVSGSTQSQSTASCVQWGAMPSGQRRVAYDTLGKFKDLHQRELIAGTPDTCAAISDYSRDISAVLSSSQDSEPLAEAVIATQERALWDLISVFFVNSLSSDGFISQDLAGWLHDNAAAMADPPQATPLPVALVARLQEAPLPEADPEYWPVLHRVVALGWITEAIELLGLHSAWLRWDRSGAEPDVQAQVAALEAVTLLLRRFPVLAGHGAAGGTGRQLDSVEEFTTYRKAWQQHCAALLQNSDVWTTCSAVSNPTARGLQHIVHTLAGDKNALEGSTRSWVDLLVSRIVHQPAVQTLADVRHVLGDSVTAKPYPSDSVFLPVLARVVDACCDVDAQTAMQACSEVCSDWFMAHISDVFAAHPAGARVLGAELPHNGGTQMEFYALEYAMALAPHANTWPLAAEYLAWCPIHGLPAFQTLLEQLPLSAADIKTVLRAQALSEEHGLSELSKALSTAQGVLAYEQGLPGAAVHWLGAAEDSSRVNAVLASLAAETPTDEAAGAAENLGLNILQSLPEGLLAGTKATGSERANLALLHIRKLLSTNGKAGDVHSAVNALTGVQAGALPAGHKTSSSLISSLLNHMDVSTTNEEDVLQLLEWLNQGGSLGSSGEEAEVQARLLNLLAALYMK